jgi:deoxycytidylate deaminase
MKECLKQTTIAIIYKDGKVQGVGSNLIRNDHIEECPRKNSKTGKDYDKCRYVCHQIGHAEEVVIDNAEEYSCIGATLYLIGHTYCCKDCIKKIKQAKIKKVIICDTGEVINL